MAADTVTRPDPSAVLSTLPGWEAASATALGGGLSNHTWLLEADGRRAVLKINPQPRQPPFNSRLEEARIQGVAAAAGLAGRVLFVTDTVYVTEYLEGTAWTRADFDDDGNLDLLASALRKLHALPLTGRTFDARRAAARYAERITTGDSVLLHRSLQTIDAMPGPRHLCCCHNDLVAGNILATPAIRFLDWEYACDNDPFFDLAAIVAHHELSTAQANRLLDGYFDGDGAHWRQQLADYERFYNAILWLWQAARDDSAG